MDTLLRVEPAFDRGVMFPGAVSGAASATAQAKDNMVLMLCICETSRANLLGTCRAEDFGNAEDRDNPERERRGQARLKEGALFRAVANGWPES
jgi:hypothetical protein